MAELELALPRPSDRCRELAGQDHCSRVCGCAATDAPRRALDGDLARRDDARHGGRATPRLTAWRGAGCCVTAGHHQPGGSGDGRPASAAAPGSVCTREGAASADAPGADSPLPFPPPPSAWWYCPSQFTLSLSASSRLLRCQPGCGPALACRRRALEAVEKVVTGPNRPNRASCPQWYLVGISCQPRLFRLCSTPLSVIAPQSSLEQTLLADQGRDRTGKVRLACERVLPWTDH